MSGGGVGVTGIVFGIVLLGLVVVLMTAGAIFLFWSAYGYFQSDSILWAIIAFIIAIILSLPIIFAGWAAFRRIITSSMRRRA